MLGVRRGILGWKWNGNVSPWNYFGSKSNINHKTRVNDFPSQSLNSITLPLKLSEMTKKATKQRQKVIDFKVNNFKEYSLTHIQFWFHSENVNLSPSWVTGKILRLTLMDRGKTRWSNDIGAHLLFTMIFSMPLRLD